MAKPRQKTNIATIIEVIDHNLFLQTLLASVEVPDVAFDDLNKAQGVVQLSLTHLAEKHSRMIGNAGRTKDLFQERADAIREKFQ